MPIMGCLASKIGEREIVAALLTRDQHLIRPGQVMLADKGFSGKDFAATAAAVGLNSCAQTARPRPTATATSDQPDPQGTT